MSTSSENSIAKHLEQLKLEADETFWEAVAVALDAESTRQSSAVGPSSLMIGAAVADRRVRETLLKAGLRWDEFITESGFEGFSPTRLESKPDDAEAVNGALSAVSSYWEIFDDRRRIDALGLAFGIATYPGEELTATLSAMGVDMAEVEPQLMRLVRSEWAAERDSSGSDEEVVPGRTEDDGDIEPLYQPNPSVARDYWTVDDQLGYGRYATAIARFIRHRDTKPPLTIGIKGPWGSGKTSVMRMVQRELDPPVDPEAEEWEFSKVFLNRTARERLALETVESEAERKAGKPVGLLTLLRRLSVAPTERIEFGGAESVRIEDKGRGRVDENHWRPTVWFNPWMYQTGEQVWAGLAQEIIKQVTDRLPLGQRERFWLELNLRRVDRMALRRRLYSILLERLLVPFLVAVLAAVVGGFLVLLKDDVLSLEIPGSVAALSSGAGVIVFVVGVFLRLSGLSAARSVPSMVSGPLISSFRDDLREDLVSLADMIRNPDYEARSGFLYLLHSDIRQVLDLVATKKRPLVVFVDDLDRCSPGVVAQTVEAINLFLAGQFPNCVFVLAVEPEVVAAHIEAAHQTLVNKLKESDVIGEWRRLGWRFLEKIVQLPLGLPRPRAPESKQYLDSLFEDSGRNLQPPGDPSGEVDLSTKEPEVPDDDARLDASTKALGPESVELAKKELARLAEAKTTPTFQDVARERTQVFDRLSKIVGESEATEIASEVAARRFAEAYSDRDPVVRRIITQQALGLPSRNPREMKRLVNLFRFFTLVANERRQLSASSTQTLEEVFEKVARLSVLAIRWPFLLNTLARPVVEAIGGEEKSDESRRAEKNGERVPIVLERLEQAANDHSEWIRVLKELGLIDGRRLPAIGGRPKTAESTTRGRRHENRDAASTEEDHNRSAPEQLWGDPRLEQLRLFLSSPHNIGSLARDFL